MTDTEMLHYLDLYSDDPVIRRLVNVLQNTQGALLTDLENAGMDPVTWKFKTDWQDQYPGDYIIQLRRDLEETEDQLKDLQDQNDELQNKYDQVKTRTIMDFVKEVWDEKRAAAFKAEDALKQARLQKEENDRLREQIDMWGKLNQVKQKV
jgi:hypothetical protein